MAVPVMRGHRLAGGDIRRVEGVVTVDSLIRAPRPPPDGAGTTSDDGAPHQPYQLHRRERPTFKGVDREFVAPPDRPLKGLSVSSRATR